jgi:hypothetical protein
MNIDIDIKEPEGDEEIRAKVMRKSLIKGIINKLA